MEKFPRPELNFEQQGSQRDEEISDLIQLFNAGKLTKEYTENWLNNVPKEEQDEAHRLEENLSTRIENLPDENKNISRRDFLKKLGILGGAFAYLSLPESVKAGVAGVGKIDRNQENPPVSLENSIIDKESSVMDKVEITPEFNRNMEKVLLSVSDKDPEEIRKIYHDLLVNMPNYSIIHILAEKGQEENFRKIIDEIQKQEDAIINLSQRLQIIPTNEQGGLDMWAQDFGEMAKINGKDTFIISADLEGPFHKFAQNRDKKRKKELSEWVRKQKIEIKQADFFFEGGNITFDKTKDGLRVFIGYSDIFYTQHLEKNSNQKPTPEMIAKKISKCFGGAEVVIMGDKELINTCFHIDQAFVILDNKQAVINQCSLPCFDNNVDVSQQLRHYKKQLEGLGYKIIEIENTPQQLKDSRSSTNVIPFVDKNTGQKKVILPIFPDEIREDAADKEKIGLHSLQGKGLAAYHAYLKAGYDPILIRDYTYIDKGNTHCISNVLSKNFTKDWDSKNA